MWSRLVPWCGQARRLFSFKFTGTLSALAIDVEPNRDLFLPHLPPLVGAVFDSPGRTLHYERSGAQNVEILRTITGPFLSVLHSSLAPAPLDMTRRAAHSS